MVSLVLTHITLKTPLPGGLEPPTFRLTVERANQLRHGSLDSLGFVFKCVDVFLILILLILYLLKHPRWDSNPQPLD